MHFDRLDEIYAMVKSILPFEQLDQTGLTSFRDRSDRSSHPSRAIFWCEQKDSVLHSTRKEKLYL